MNPLIQLLKTTRIFGVALHSFSRNLFLPYVRIATAVTLMSAGAAMAWIAAKPSSGVSNLAIPSRVFGGTGVSNVPDLGTTPVGGSHSNLQTRTLDNTALDVQTITVGNAEEVFPSGWPEVTTAAYGPGEHPHCPNGRLFFGTGNSIVATNLMGDIEMLPGNAPNPWSAQFNETYPPFIIFDNHLVKLTTGELVYTFEGVTWNDNISPHPDWWERTITYPLKGQSHPGGRANIYVYRSSDCGATWDHIPDIDAATLEVANVTGLCGVPRLKSDNQGRRSEAGGWDGHFLYADPYSGYLFVSTICVYGSDQENDEKVRSLLIVSRDRGDTWSVIGDRQDLGIFRAPISSINSGQVGFAFVDGTSLKFSVFDASADTVDLAQAATIAATNTQGGFPSSIATDNFCCGGGFPSLAGNNLDPPSFYAAMYNWIDGELTFNLYNATATTATQLGSPVRTQNAGGAVIHASFIEPLPNSTTSVYYWTDINPSQPNSYSLRFQVLSEGEPVLLEPGQLTLRNNQPYTWQYNGQFIGDYHTGAAYQSGIGSTAFVAPWSENGSLHFNTIHIGATADLSIAKTDSPDPVTVGNNLTYTVTVTNNGPAPATSVTVTDNLPAETTFVSCSSTGGGVCAGAGNNRTVTFASLASGESETITFVATVNCSVADGTVISNTASVSSPIFDPNSNNNLATATTTASNPPPTITGAAADPSVLWPPNHRLVNVTVSYEVTDNCPLPPNSCTLSVTSNEPINGQGDGDTFPDWIILDAHHVQLRAERAGNGDGRIYTITITCIDSGGNSSSEQVEVRVPHDRGRR